MNLNKLIAAVLSLSFVAGATTNINNYAPHYSVNANAEVDTAIVTTTAATTTTVTTTKAVATTTTKADVTTVSTTKAAATTTKAVATTTANASVLSTTAVVTTTAKPATSVTNTGTTTVPVAQDYTLGDVNSDSLINAVDASSVLSYYAMISTNKDGGFDEKQKAAADVNNDGSINAVDASCILSYYAYTSTNTGIVKSLADFMKGETKTPQQFVHKAESPDNAITEVQVSLECTGDVKETMKVESIMGKDKMCSEVVGLVGEPFSIETSSEFDKATITYKVDKSKLGDTNFNDLMFLWYDRENDNFVELDTKHDEENSTVSVETTHFSSYPLVDGKVWIENWEDIAERIKPFYQYKNKKEGNSGEYNTDTHIQFIDSSENIIIENDNDFNYIKSVVEPFPIGKIEYLISWKNDESILGARGLCAYNLDTLKENLTKERIFIETRPELSYTHNYNCALATHLCSGLLQHPPLRIYFVDCNFSIEDEEIPYSRMSRFYSLFIGKCFIVNLGGANNVDVLKEVASKTGGEYFEVTEDNKNEVKEKLQTIIRDNLVFEDTDKDGFVDKEETNGWIFKSNGTQIQTNPKKKDSDDDGLIDSVEIEKEIKEQEVTINGSVYKYYHKINSDPNLADSDGDGYSDICDPEPINTPQYLNGKYDFLDGEIYFIQPCDLINYDCIEVDDSSSLKCNCIYGEGNDNQKFKFEWCGSGYKIHALNNETQVLTVRKKDDKSYSVIMTASAHDLTSEQLWEVLPYEKTKGLLIRSKVLHHDLEEEIVKPLFLTYSDDQMLTVSMDMDTDTVFSLKSLEEKWSRFGTLYMEQQGWIELSNDKKNIDRAIKNCYYNTKIKIGNNNVISYPSETSGKELLINQFDKDGGHFTMLSFADVPMRNVCCEVMGTYNAMKLKSIIDKDTDFTKFFRLSAEFEINAIRATLLVGDYSDDGAWGSVPEKIAYCLNSYNVKEYKCLKLEDFPSSYMCEYTAVDGETYYDYDYSRVFDSFDEEMEKGMCGIVSYNWAWTPFEDSELGLETIEFYQGIHTYAELYDQFSSKFVMFNKSCSAQLFQTYDSTATALKYDNDGDGVVDSIEHYLVGYILY